MADPKGKLITVVGFDTDGNPRAFELTADDFLRVYIEGGTVDVGTHKILDGTVHDDSVGDAVTRGSIIVGNATPMWDELVLGGDNEILASDGSDLLFETLASLIKAALLTADGDVLIRSGGTVQRLAKGSDGEVLTLAAGVPTWAAAGALHADIGCRVYNDANITLSSGVETSLTFNQERWDTDAIHDPGSNPNRLTCVTAGKYIIFGSCTIAKHATGNRTVRIRLNGSDNIAGKRLPAMSAYNTIFDVLAIYDLAVDDYVEFRAYQNSGGNLDVIAAVYDSPEFGMQMLVAT